MLRQRRLLGEWLGSPRALAWLFGDLDGAKQGVWGRQWWAAVRKVKP